MFDLNWARLDALKAKLDEHRPLSKEIVSNLHDNLVLSCTYHSNDILLVGVGYRKRRNNRMT